MSRGQYLLEVVSVWGFSTLYGKMGLMARKIIVFCFILALIMGNFAIPSKVLAACDPNNLNIENKTNAELQQILDECDKEIAAQQKIIDANRDQQKTLNKGISDLSATINKSQLEIKAKATQIKKLGDNITEKKQYIGKLETRMEEIKKSISRMLRETYSVQETSDIEILLSSKSLSSFFTNVNDFQTINEKLHDLIMELTDTKKTTEDQKKDLEDKKAQVEKLKFEEEKAKALTETLKKEKQKILDATKGQEKVYQKVLADKERLKNQISNRLFRTVGGTEITFGEAVKLIQPYESTIGVDAALVLAVLTQESSVDGLIGKNIGKCYYNQSAKNSSNQVMAPSQVSSFLAIMSDIGLNPDTTPVSCPIYSDGAYGGAMGPAQFMPKTWWDIEANVGYKKRVGSVIGTSIPSPFNNKEAFVGTALYLKDAQDRCKTAFSAKSDIWACAASKYYGGLALKGTRLNSYMYGKYGYGHQVAVRAAQFQNDINTLAL